MGGNCIMTESWPIRRQLTRTLPNGDYMVVTAGLHKLDGNERPYFSVTASVWEKRGNRSGKSRANTARSADLGGTMHEEILKAFPKLKPVVLVHLADDNGTPMHTVTNGWYFYSGGHIDYETKNYGPEYITRQGTPHERAARALNIPAEDLPTGLDKTDFEAFAKSLRDRWSQQARTAIELLESL
jgi:hypothetical protein